MDRRRGDINSPNVFCPLHLDFHPVARGEVALQRSSRLSIVWSREYHGQRRSRAEAGSIGILSPPIRCGEDQRRAPGLSQRRTLRTLRIESSLWSLPDARRETRRTAPKPGPTHLLDSDSGCGQLKGDMITAPQLAASPRQRWAARKDLPSRIRSTPGRIECGGRLSTGQGSFRGGEWAPNLR
jgi:hypothetical protein